MAAEPAVIDVRHLVKTYRMGEVEVRALNGVSLTIAAGDYVAVMGSSGSGKTTLMNILGLLDVPTQGSYLLDGLEVARLAPRELAELRNRKIGFVFQNFNLLPRTTALENVELPLLYRSISSRARHQRARDALARVGLADRHRHRPNQLSGGQQQRVAIARALVNEPRVILADEPTGNLDSVTGEEMMQVLTTLNERDGILIMLVTHEQDIARHARRRVHVRDGCIIADELLDGASPASLAAGAAQQEQRAGEGRAGGEGAPQGAGVVSPEPVPAERQAAAPPATPPAEAASSPSMPEMGT
ncbi:MAG: ABC transporter ATP-binding protein [Candidatus Tectomicrobia bacterium]|nr:ABC transporter ATP-binding protein [Candidatus Tectomicrobia bacterium]